MSSIPAVFAGASTPPGRNDQATTSAAIRTTQRAGHDARTVVGHDAREVEVDSDEEVVGETFPWLRLKGNFSKYTLWAGCARNFPEVYRDSE
eukprot:6155610-Prymnesium_polylepis.1